MSPDDLYLRLGLLVETMPNLAQPGPVPADTHLWLGRAHALVDAAGAGAGMDAINFAMEVSHLTSAYPRALIAQTVAMLVYRALAHAELNAPAPMQGAFLPVGTPFDAMVAIGKILQRAERYALIVDPYLDENALSDFAVMAGEGIEVHLLGSHGDTKPAVKPAFERWKAQYGLKRPMEIRLAAPRSLHDRLVNIDGREAWIITQSLNKIASRSPATISRATTELTELKIPFYSDLWAAATPL